MDPGKNREPQHVCVGYNFCCLEICCNSRRWQWMLWKQMFSSFHYHLVSQCWKEEVKELSKRTDGQRRAYEVERALWKKDQVIREVCHDHLLVQEALGGKKCPGVCDGCFHYVPDTIASTFHWYLNGQSPCKAPLTIIYFHTEHNSKYRNHIRLPTSSSSTEKASCVSKGYLLCVLVSQLKSKPFCLHYFYPGWPTHQTLPLNVSQMFFESTEISIILE